MSDDDGKGSEFAIDTLEHLQHHLAGGIVQRAGRFVAEQYIRSLRHGAGDRYPLLLAAG
jgi:hypothetical protein